MAFLFTSGKFQAFTNSGAPLASGKVYTYEAGGLTPLATYTTQLGNVANANPVILDSSGRANIWLGAASYRIIVKTSADVTIYDTDNISPGFDQTAVFEQVFTATAGQTVFTITGHTYTQGTNSITVFMNGKMLRRVTDYSETSTSSITLVRAAELDDEVTVRAAVDVSWVQPHPIEIQIACSDETTALTAGTAKVTFRTPTDFTLTEARASLTTAQTSGNIFTVDINEAGASILSTKLTIDNTEKTSVTAATQPVISDTAIADDAEMTIDIDQIGDGTAKGLKVTLIGVR